MNGPLVGPPTELGPERPLRVHVVGNSAAVMVVPHHGPRDGGNYGEQLGPLLAAGGVPTVVTHACRWFGMVHEVIPRYEQDVRNHFPDVLVLHFGMAECQPNTLPTSLVRHFTTWHRTSRAPAVAYRRWAAPALWSTLRDYQRWAAARDQHSHRLGPRRFRADMRRLVELARTECGCLVLLVDVDPPGARLEYWLPGLSGRVERYNRLLRDIAGDFDGQVRLVPASRSLRNPDVELPDGLHRAPDGHRLTAQLLVGEITRWLGGSRP